MLGSVIVFVFGPRKWEALVGGQRLGWRLVSSKTETSADGGTREPVFPRTELVC